MLDRWAEVSDLHTFVLSFFEWLEENGIRYEFDYNDACPPDLPSYDMKPSTLLDAFLEIDRVQLDDERRELLEQQRQSNEAVAARQAVVQNVETAQPDTDLRGEAVEVATQVIKTTAGQEWLRQQLAAQSVARVMEWPEDRLTVLVDRMRHYLATQ